MTYPACMHGKMYKKTGAQIESNPHNIFNAINQSFVWNFSNLKRTEKRNFETAFSQVFGKSKFK